MAKFIKAQTREGEIVINTDEIKYVSKDAKSGNAVIWFDHDFIRQLTDTYESVIAQLGYSQKKEYEGQ